MLAVFPAMLLAASVARAAAAPGQPDRQGAGEAMALVELLVPRKTVRPGETISVGVRFTMQPGWHIYWKNPGDSGQAPVFRWTLPGGGAARVMRGAEWKATDPQFPVPTKWIDSAGLVGYGYAQSVIFPAELTVPGSVTPGQSAEVGVWTQYMVCKDVCLKEEAGAKVELYVSADSGESDQNDAAMQKQIEAAKSSLPTPTKAEAKASEEGMVEVSVAVPAGAREVDFFPDPPEGLAVEEVTVSREGDRAVARLSVRAYAGAKVKAREFEGVFGFDANGGRRGVSVRVPVPAEALAGASEGR